MPLSSLWQWQIPGVVTSNEWNKDKNVWGIYQYSFRIVSHLPGVPELRPSQSKQVFQVTDLEVLADQSDQGLFSLELLLINFAMSRSRKFIESPG